MVCSVCLRCKQRTLLKIHSLLSLDGDWKTERAFNRIGKKLNKELPKTSEEVLWSLQKQDYSRRNFWLRSFFAGNRRRGIFPEFTSIESNSNYFHLSLTQFGWSYTTSENFLVSTRWFTKASGLWFESQAARGCDQTPPIVWCGKSRRV